MLADDLIWATRLLDGVRRAGGDPVAARTLAAFDAGSPARTAALVDLTARAYDGLGALAPRQRPASRRSRSASTTTSRSQGGAQGRGRARVYAYRALFEARRRDARRPGSTALRAAKAGRSTEPVIPAARYGERLAARAARRPQPASTRCSSASGADLRYLTGYEAMPARAAHDAGRARPRSGAATLIAPRLEATPAALAAPPPRPALVEVATWEETDDPIAPGRLARSARRGRDAARRCARSP